MPETVVALQTPVRNRGWSVTAAGMGINLALGVLYSWSIISGGMKQAGWGWSKTAQSLPYSVACLVFSVIMVPAGRMQDRIGPRVVATIGGLLVGAGMILAGLSGNSVSGYVIGFGVLAGAGMGFGYASATPPAVKWFPKAKTGLIAGLVVSGFGLASVYIAPVSNWLIGATGVGTTAIILGAAFLVVVTGLAQLLRSPPAGYQPPEPQRGAAARAGAASPAGAGKKEDFAPREMLGTWQFYLLWFMYACGAGAGLMVISVAKSLADSVGKQAELVGVIAVATLAVGNGAGRILAGIVSDRIGRKGTLAIFFLVQAVMVVLLSLAAPGNLLGSAAALPVITAVVGANYGANLSLFPSATKDYYGLKNLGMNYGLVFTAWGVGGFVLATVAGWIKDATGTFTYSYYLSAGLLATAAILTGVVRPPRRRIALSPA